MDVKFWIVDIVGMLFSAIISVVLSNIGMSITTSICISIILLLIIVLGQLTLKIIDLKKYIKNYNFNDLKQNYENLEQDNKELKQRCDNLEQKNKTLKARTIDVSSENGDILLFMALTQDFAEPLKISLLKKSADKYQNVVSALILANIYEYGIEKDNSILFKADKEKAFEMYKMTVQRDNYGVCDWMLGWYYQNNLVSEAQILDEDTRLNKAKEYYETSKEAGFPKAMNSLGNFIAHEKLGFKLSKNTDEMITNYKTASQRGDIYATLNLGNYYFKMYGSNKDMDSLNKAEELYQEATEMKSPEGFVKLGFVKVEKYNRINDNKMLEEAKECFVSSLAYGNNQFTAAGYFMIGNLLKQHPDCFNQDEIRNVIFSNGNNYPNTVIGCYVKSYEIFLSLSERNKTISGENTKIYESLSESFQNVKFTPFDNSTTSNVQAHHNPLNLL